MIYGLQKTIKLRRTWLLVFGLVFLVGFAVVGLKLYNNQYLVRKLYVMHVWTALNGIERKPNAMISMLDGVKLAADIYLPKRFDPPYPVIYIQTIYGKKDFFGSLEALQMFGPNGYAIVSQDVRGRFDSEGEFRLYESVPSDGWETLSWIAQQPWSSGNVGTFGCSALGEAQYILAVRDHPNHKAMIIESGGGAIGAANDRHGYAGLYEGGIFNLASGVGWFASAAAKSRVHEQRGTVNYDLLKKLPIVSLVERSGSEPTLYEEYVSHQPGDPWWKNQPYIDEAKGFQVPGLHINQWFDLGVEDSLDMAFPSQTDEPPAPQWAIISPAAHCGSTEFQVVDRIGELEVLGGNLDYESTYLDFFDRWLKHESQWDEPRVRLFVLGENRWRSFDQWPPAEASEIAWFLASDGNANTAGGDGKLLLSPADPDVDSFVYDPRDPVATKGGVHCCTGNPEDQPGIFDQSESASRADVLVYDSAPLNEPVTIAGPVDAVLFVQTSAPDTDFTVKLVDVWPNGRAYNIQDGAFRLRYREGYDTPLMAKSGEVYEIQIGLRAIAYQFKSGHRLRLEVSSSNFPRLARNLNTGGVVELEEIPIVATNQVHHGGNYTSRLIVRALAQPIENGE